MSNSRPPIRVLIVADQPAKSEGLSALLSGYPDIEVLGQVENEAEVLALLETRKIDILLLNFTAHRQTGIDIARDVHDSHPALKVIVLTNANDTGYLRAAFRAGVCGFLIRNTARKNLVDSIRAVMNDERFLSPALVSTVLSHYHKPNKEQAQGDAADKRSSQRDGLFPQVGKSPA